MHSIRLAMIARRVAFLARYSVRHVKDGDIETMLSGLSEINPSLFKKFQELMVMHNDCLMELTINAVSGPISSFMINKIKKMHSGLMVGMQDLIDMIKKEFPDIDFTEIDKMTDGAGSGIDYGYGVSDIGIFRVEILNPNTMNAQMSYWTQGWHEVFSMLVFKVRDAIKGDKNVSDDEEDVQIDLG